MRKVILAANWKMYKTIKEGIDYIKCLEPKIDNFPEVVLFPPFTAIAELSKVIRSSNISLGAQNMYFETKGAYTGEISPIMIKDAGARYVLIGHSERRNIFKEEDELINKKMISAIKNGLIPIFCIGETLQERNSMETEKVLKKQIEIGLRDVAEESEFIIAYEPVWAIGTGINATPEQIREAHAFIRDFITYFYSKNKSENIPILYGGSVKTDNINKIAEVEDVDGGLVGGASLDCESFYEIWNRIKVVKRSKR